MFKERETSPFSAFGSNMKGNEGEIERNGENCGSVVADRGLEQPIILPVIVIVILLEKI